MVSSNPIKRIAVLLDHSGQNDTRVMSSVRTLQDGGYLVQVFTLQRDNTLLPNWEPPSDITFTPVHVMDREIVPIPKPMIAIGHLYKRCKRAMFSLRTGPDMSNQATKIAPIRGSVSLESSPRNSISPVNNAPFKTFIQNTLAALFWHAALSRAFILPVRTFHPDIILAHDLSMLGTARALADKLRCSFIYDAHEFESGRNGVPQTLAERIRQSFEGIHITHAAAVITVGEAIADLMAHQYNIQRPIVVPNIPESNTVIPLSRARFGLSKTAPLVAYVGSLQAGRGLQNLIKAMSSLQGYQLLLLGSGTAERIQTLQSLIAAEDVTVHLIDTPVPSHDVINVLAMADVSVLPLRASCISYTYCLPNKLFQSLTAGVPVVSTPLPEIEAVLAITGGQVASGWSAKALADSIRAVKRPKTLPAAYNFKAIQARYLDAVDCALSGAKAPKYPALPHWSPLPEAFIADRGSILKELRKSQRAARVLIQMARVFQMA